MLRSANPRPGLLVRAANPLVFRFRMFRMFRSFCRHCENAERFEAKVTLKGFRGYPHIASEHFPQSENTFGKYEKGSHCSIKIPQLAILMIEMQLNHT